jgi:hypothetical protein
MRFCLGKSRKIVGGSENNGVSDSFAMSFVLRKGADFFVAVLFQRKYHPFEPIPQPESCSSPLRC